MRLFLTLVCGPGSYEDLLELYEPIKQHFTGLCAVCHADRDSMEARYLELSKGAGMIVYLPYVGRHDLSRNVALHCGAIQHGDWVMQCDTLERLVPTFIEQQALPWYGLTGMQPNCWLYYGKPIMFKYHESMRYVGTPHEGLRRDDGGLKAVELSQGFPDESQVRVNMRPVKRKDPYHWLAHYIRYYLGTPWGGNHCLLGNEHRGDPMKLYQERETLRIEVREHLRSQGVPLNEHGLKKYMMAGITPTMAGYIEKERILNDAYRYWVLDDKTVVDDHTWTGMVKIDSPANPLDKPAQSE